MGMRSCCLGLAMGVVMLPRVATAQSPAWTVSPQVVVEQEPITFPSKGAELHGVLYFAVGSSRQPTMVVLHGASSPSKDLPLYRHLKQMLPRLGMAVFVFDRRGSGASGGNRRDALDFKMLAEDGVAASRALAKDPHVDGARIGYWGISQGGWLALLAASEDARAAFAIAVSAPMTTPDVQMNFAVANILRIDGYSDEDVALAVKARSANDAYLRGTERRADAAEALKAVRDKPWFPLIYQDATPDDPKTSTWLRQMEFDPVPVLARVKAPVLMVYGEADPWVPVGESLRRLKARAAKDRNVQTVVINGADHTMMLDVDPKEQIDPKFFAKEQPDAPAYFAELTAWLERQVLTQ
ncbi:MAG: alpha/beta fold hydrolase [Acidobacteriaceae bacterium]